MALACPSTCQACNLTPSTSKRTSNLAAPLTGNRRWFGVQFDIKAKRNIVVESLDIQINNQGAYTAEVYARNGRTNVSRETWSLICRKRVTGGGRGQLVPLNCGTSFPVLANDFANLYVTLVEDSRLIINELGASATSTALQDSSDLTLYTGLAVTYNNRNFFPGYAFTGRVRYASETCQDQEGNVVVDEDTVGARTCRWLAENRLRYEFACTFTGPAQHCPSTCQVCN